MLHERHDIVSSGVLSPVLFLRDIVMVYCHEGGLEIEHADLALHNTNYCSEELLVHLFRILKSSLPLLTLIFPTFKFSPSLFTLSSTLFPPSPIVSPFSQTWLDLKLHVSTVYYYHPLEFRSNLLVLEPPVLTSVSVLYMHLCIHPLFLRLVLVSPLKLHDPHQS